MTDLMESLEEATAPPEPDYETEPLPPLDRKHANDLMWHLGQVEDQMSLVRVAAEAMRDERLERINLWEATELARLRARAGWLRRALEAWLRSEIARNPKSKTVHLPDGTAKAAKQQPEWEVVDRPALMAWLQRAAPELIRRPAPSAPPPAPDMAKIKKALAVPEATEGSRVAPVSATGEVVPGLAVTIRGDKVELIPTPPPAPEPEPEPGPNPLEVRLADLERTVAAAKDARARHPQPAEPSHVDEPAEAPEFEL